MNIVIEKNGKQIAELCEIYLGYGISQFTIKCGTVQQVISAERVLSILDTARQNGCEIFCYSF